MAWWNNLFWILAIICAVWVIYDAWNRRMDTGMKVLWTVLAILFSIITAIVYYFVVYRR